MGNEAGKTKNNLEKDHGKGAGVSSSVLEWGLKGGTGLVPLEKNRGGGMRCMAQQGTMMMMMMTMIFRPYNFLVNQSDVHFLNVHKLILILKRVIYTCTVGTIEVYFFNLNTCH